MAYRLSLTDDLGEEVKRVAREQIHGALDGVHGAGDARSVHTARKRLKMARSLVRLVRDPLGRTRYKDVSGTLRDIGRRLSSVRDADVLISTVDGLPAEGREADQAMRSVRNVLGTDREHGMRVLHESLTLARERLQGAGDSIGEWPLQSLSMRDVLDGFAQGYARGREAFHTALADPGTAHLHDWRKRAKDLWYHLRLLQQSWPCLTAEWASEAHRLTGLLGDDHDLAVLRERIESLAAGGVSGRDLAPIRAVIRARREHLQQDATFLGLRIYAEKRRAVRRRIRTYIRACREEAAREGRRLAVPAA